MRSKRWPPAALALAASAALFTVPATAEEAPPRGKQVLLAEKCNICHSLAADGIPAKTKSDKLKGPDLAGATQRHERDWLTAFLRQELEVEGEEHKRAFKGSDEELAALLDWLAEFPAEDSP